MSHERRTTENFEIVVDPDAVVASLRDRHEHGRRRHGQKVLTVWPPFEGRSHAEHRFSHADNQWPSSMDVSPLDLNPNVFIESDERAAIEDLLAEETDFDSACEWAHEVRATLQDTIDIAEFAERPSEQVAVRYEDK